MNYKLICIDMDGTLLNKNHNVSERNKEILRKAQDKGVTIALTTGRMYTSARIYSDIIGIDSPIISGNGTNIRDKVTDELMYSLCLNKEQLCQIDSIVKDNGFDEFYYTYNCAIGKKDFPENHPYIINNKTAKEKDKINIFISEDIKKAFDRFNDKIVKCICIDNREDKGRLFKIKEELQKNKELEVVSSASNNFEVMRAGSSKGKAVSVLADKYGIKREEVICIGDNENDLSMINYAGLGVAMGNACDLLKENADYITDTNENDGVAKVIEKFVL